MADESASLDAIEAELTELAAHINSGTARFLALVAEFDARMGWAEWGCRSCAHWLAHHCGVSPVTARHQVRVANRLRELPLIRAAFEAGELSCSQVRALCRIATEATEEDLLAIARHATAADLEIMCRSYGAATRDEDAEPHYVTCYEDDDGTWIVAGRLSPDAGATFRRALESGADDVRKQTRGSAEPPSASERYALAAAAMAETYLAKGPAARCGGDRYLVVVHTDADDLAAEGTNRRLCCDASVVGLVHNGARPPDLGRKTRIISPALRRALLARDRHCIFPGCTEARFVDAHHLHSWADGGATDLDNLALLCRFHHMLVHEGGFVIHKAPDGDLLFLRPDGRAVAKRPETPPASGPDLEARNRACGATIDEHTCTPLSGDRMDHDLAVHGLLSTERFSVLDDVRPEA